jgi:hypothetical protein
MLIHFINSRLIAGTIVFRALAQAMLKISMT